MYIMHNGKKYSASDAKNISFDNTNTTLASTNVEDAIKEQNSNLTASDNLKFKFGKDGDGNYGYYGADGSLIPFNVDSDRKYLYLSGKEFESVTGGWIFNSNKNGGSLLDCLQYGATNSKRKYSDGIYLYINITSASGSLGFASCYSKNAIDLTNYSKLVVFADVSTGSKGASIQIRNVNPCNGGQYTNRVLTLTPFNGLNYGWIDISSLSGKYWILLILNGYGGDNGGNPGSKSMKIHKIWLE